MWTHNGERDCCKPFTALAGANRLSAPILYLLALEILEALHFLLLHILLSCSALSLLSTLTLAPVICLAHCALHDTRVSHHLPATLLLQHDPRLV